MSGKRIVWVVWPLVLAACTEQPQTISSNPRADAHASQGTGAPPPFTAGGWKNGDKAGWEQALKVRTQMGQNDYNKVP